MIGNHFKKKFSKRPPPSIIVTEVTKNQFSDNVESFVQQYLEKLGLLELKKIIYSQS